MNGVDASNCREQLLPPTAEDLVPFLLPPVLASSSTLRCALTLLLPKSAALTPLPPPCRRIPSPNQCDTQANQTKGTSWAHGDKKELSEAGFFGSRCAF